MLSPAVIIFFFFFNDTATTEIYTLSLHDALPIWRRPRATRRSRPTSARPRYGRCSNGSTSTNWRTSCARSEEHTSELQSPCNLVCRLLLEKKKKNKSMRNIAIVNNQHGAHVLSHD